MKKKSIEIQNSRRDNSLFLLDPPPYVSCPLHKLKFWVTFKESGPAMSWGKLNLGAYFMLVILPTVYRVEAHTSKFDLWYFVLLGAHLHFTNQVGKTTRWCERRCDLDPTCPIVNTKSSFRLSTHVSIVQLQNDTKAIINAPKKWMRRGSGSNQHPARILTMDQLYLQFINWHDFVSLLFNLLFCPYNSLFGQAYNIFVQNYR